MHETLPAGRWASSAVVGKGWKIASTAVGRPRPSTPSRAAPIAARASGRSPAELARVEHPLDLDAADRRRDRTAEQQARNVGQEENPVGAEPDRERSRRLVGVDVQWAFGKWRDDRDQRRLERLGDGSGRDGCASPTSPSLGTGVACEPDLVAEERTARGPSAAQISALTAANECADNLEPGRGRHSPAADEA